MKICLLSYTALGYGTPQIVYILKSLEAFYEKKAEIFVYEPLCYPTHPSTKRDYPNYLFCEAQLDSAFYSNAVKWIETTRPSLLIITHYKFFGALLESKFKPKSVLYWEFESPFEDWAPLQKDIDNYSRIEPLLDLAIYPEKNRLRFLNPNLKLKNTKKIFAYNSSPNNLINIQKNLSKLNGKILVQGGLHADANLANFIINRKNTKLPIDMFGASYYNTLSPDAHWYAYLHDDLCKARANYSYNGLLKYNELIAIRPHYNYMLILWKPDNINRRYACPNKFFEAIASGVVPITGPHPQCVEIIKKYNCGIVMEDWTQQSFDKSLKIATQILNTKKYKELRDNCIYAHKKELNWENEFEKIKSILPVSKIKNKIFNKKQPKFIILDPSLENEIGHYHTYDTGVLLAATKRKFRAIIVSNQFMTGFVPKNIEILPLFSIEFWGRWTLSENRIFRGDASDIFVSEMIDALERIDVNENDHIFIPNISDSYLDKLSKFFQNSNKFNKCKWHIVIRHPVKKNGLFFNKLKFYSSFLISDKKLSERICHPATHARMDPILRILSDKLNTKQKKLVSHIDDSKKHKRIDSIFKVFCEKNNKHFVRFYVDTKALMKNHKKIAFFPIKLLPIPINAGSSDIIKNNKPFNIKKNNRELIVIYPGDARREKGFLHLPTIVKRTRWLDNNIKFKFKFHSFQTAKDHEIDDAIKQLYMNASDCNIELIDTPQSPENYSLFIQKSDIILTLYDPNSYKERSSNIFLEALTHGKIPILLSGSSMCEIFPKHSVFICDYSSQVPKRLEYIASNWSTVTKEVYTIRKNLLKHHTPDNLVNTLLSK